MHGSLRFASYNVHGFAGPGGDYDPDSTLEVIARLDADVVAMQEVRADGRRGLAPLQDFCRTHGQRLVLGPTLGDGAHHGYGNALLVKGDLESTELHDISLPRREPRGVIEAATRFGSAAWRIFATHLGLSPGERRQQVEMLLALIRRREATENTVLMGDLNEWFLWGRPLRRLRAHFRSGRAPATFPARRPVFALDRIWVHPIHRLQRVWAVRSERSVAASDHLPVVADVA